MTENNIKSQKSSDFYKYHFEDGLWELFSGLFLVELAVLYFFDRDPTSLYSLIIVLVSLVMQMTIHSFIKQRVTVPRVGKKPPKPPRKSNSSRKILASIAFTIAGLGIILLYLNAQGFIEWNNSSSTLQVWDEIQLIILLPFISLIANIVITIKKKKFTIDLLLLSVAIGLEIFFLSLGIMRSGYPIMVAGSCVALIGIIRLTRFLRKYQKGENKDGIDI